MNTDSEKENTGMTMMIIATSLCAKYDEWKNDTNIMKIVDVNKNSICIGLKNIYPTMETKVMQSIALSFTMYFIILLQQNKQNQMDILKYIANDETNLYNESNGYVKIDLVEVDLVEVDSVEVDLVEVESPD